MDLHTEISRRIQERGRLTFAEYMELALYWPEGGYYYDPGNIGPGGDFYTAPGAHPAFAALLCVQLFQMWRLLGGPSAFWIVEMGAGTGLLCHDLVRYSSHMPSKFHESLRYLCLDRLAAPGLESRLQLGSRRHVGRLNAESIPLRGIIGCILSNELVDSFPVHRVTVEQGELREIYVTLEEGKLAEVIDSPSSPCLAERLTSLDIRLAEGSTAEINLAIGPWLEGVSSSLERGFLLTIDYGHPATELYSHQRRRGTLTCFYRHTQTDNPYVRVGSQDISAHVDFTTLVSEGRRHGLEPLGFGTQTEFLKNLGIQRLLRRLQSTGLKQREIDANRMGILEIMRPGGMGDFKVSCQGKGVGGLRVWGFDASNPEAELWEMPVPTLESHHMPLFEGRYPHSDIEWGELWPLGGGEVQEGPAES